MSIMFRYSPEKALQAGAASYIQTSGAYVGKITAAKWIRAKSSQSQAKALELSFESQDGQKANFINIWYSKSDGSPSLYGENHIHAIMGLTQVQQLNSAVHGNDFICPELLNKPIGLIVQKVWFTKDNGEESYKLDLVLAYGANTGKTLEEAVTGKEALTVAKIVAHLKDRDERKAKPASNSNDAPLTPPPPSYQQAVPAAPIDNMKSDIPF